MPDYDINEYRKFRNQKLGSRKPQQESDGLLSSIGNFIEDMNNEFQKKKFALDRAVINVLEEPGRLLNEGLSQLGSNPIAGGINIGNSLLSFGAIPFGVSDALVRQLPSGQKIADIVALPFEKTGEIINKGTEELSNLTSGLPEGLKNLGLKRETADEIASALNVTNQMLGQIAVGGVMSKVGGKLLPERESFKPIELTKKREAELQKEEFPQIKEPERKLLPPSPINLRTTRDEIISQSQAKLQLDELANKRAELKQEYELAKGKEKKSLLKELKTNADEIKGLQEITGQKLTIDQKTLKGTLSLEELAKEKKVKEQTKPIGNETLSTENKPNTDAIKERIYNNLQWDKNDTGSRKLKLINEAKKDAKLLREQGINAQVKQDGRKWNLYIDNIKQNKRELGLVKEIEKTRIEDVEVANQNATKPYSELGEQKKLEQQIIAETFVEPKDLPSGLGQKTIDKGIADIKNNAGREQSKEAQLVREIVEDKLENGAEITPIKGMPKETVTGEQIKEYANEKIKDEFSLTQPNVITKKTKPQQMELGGLGAPSFKGAEDYLIKTGKGEETTPLFQQENIKGQEKLFGSENKIFTKEKFTEADKYQKENLNKLGANPFVDPKYYESAFIKAGYYFEGGVRKFPDFAKKMVEEYGDNIKPYLLKLWSDVKKQEPRMLENTKNEFKKIDKSYLSPREKTEAILQENQFAKELQQFLISPDIPKDIQEKIIGDIKGKEIDYSGRNIGFFRRKALDRGTNLTKKYGAPGGEIFHRGMRGSEIQKSLLENSYDRFLNPLREIINKSPERFKGEIAPQIIKALEDRANAEKYLTTPEAKQSYELVKGLYDYFRGELDKAGIKTVDDYFTHQLVVDITDRIFSDEIMNADPRNLKKGSLNDYYSANSPYAKERRSDIMALMNTDLVNVLNNYVHSMARHLGYKNLIEFYKNDFINEINKNPILKTKTDLSYAKEHLKGVLYPEIVNSKTAKFITNRRNNMYQALLWNNFKAGLQNLGQKFLTQFFISKESQLLTNNIYHNQKMITGRLADAMAEIKRGDVAHYLDIPQQEAIRVKGEKYDFFRVSEKGNWTYSELAGLIEATNRISKVKSIEDINKILSDQKNFDKAIREARDLSSKTQYNPDVAFRPLAYDKWALRTFAMFTRYPIGTTDLFAKTIIKSLEGIDGLRAQTILRRGLIDADAIKPVEFLRATEYYRKSLENSLKQSKKEGYNFAGVPEKNVRQLIDFYKKKESELNSIIAKLEPMNKAKNSKIWAKYLGYSALISFTYRMIQAQLWQAIGITDKKEKTLAQQMTNTLIDVSPLPFYRFNPREIVNTPLIPNSEFMLYGNWNFRSGARGLIDYGLNTTPYLNIANQSLQRIAGKTGGEFITKDIFPKKKSSRNYNYQRSYNYSY